MMVFSKEVKSLYKKYQEILYKAFDIAGMMDETNDAKKLAALEKSYKTAMAEKEKAEAVFCVRVYKECFEKNPVLTNSETKKTITWKEIFGNKTFEELSALKKCLIINIYENSWEYKF